MTLQALESSIKKSPAMQGASFGAFLDIVTRKVPTWLDPKTPSSLVNRSIFSGALAGAIIGEVNKDAMLAAKTILPKVWQGLQELGDWGKVALKLSLIATGYFGLTKIENVFCYASWNSPTLTPGTLRPFEWFLRNASYYGTKYSLNLLDNVPITQEITPMLRVLGKDAVALGETIAPLLPFEPMKLGSVLVSLGLSYEVALFISKNYRKDFDKWAQKVKDDFNKGTYPYIEIGLWATQFASVYYLNEIIYKKLGPYGSAASALFGIPAMALAREAVLKGTLPPLNPQDFANVLANSPVFQALYSLETLLPYLTPPTTPALIEPIPTEPIPTELIPTEPIPTDQVLVELVPMEPTPVERAPPTNTPAISNLPPVLVEKDSYTPLAKRVYDTFIYHLTQDPTGYIPLSTRMQHTYILIKQTFYSLFSTPKEGYHSLVQRIQALCSPLLKHRSSGQNTAE
jgi:hypothetical protein